MLNDRLAELRRRPDPPFLSAYSGSSSMVRTRDVVFQSARVDQNGLARGLDTLLVELARVDKHGFQATELERAKREMLRYAESAYAEREKEESSDYAEELSGFFLSGEPMPGEEARPPRERSRQGRRVAAHGGEAPRDAPDLHAKNGRSLGRPREERSARPGAPRACNRHRRGADSRIGRHALGPLQWPHGPSEADRFQGRPDPDQWIRARWQLSSAGRPLRFGELRRTGPLRGGPWVIRPNRTRQGAEREDRPGVRRRRWTRRGHSRQRLAARRRDDVPARLPDVHDPASRRTGIRGLENAHEGLSREPARSARGRFRRQDAGDALAGPFPAAAHDPRSPR